VDPRQQDTARAIVNIFETGRIQGNYAAVGVLPGDTGHLSYGRSQAALGSGTLFQLLNTYCNQPNAAFAAQLKPALPRFQSRDVSLDFDTAVKQLLKQAGSDPVMRNVQDEFFNSLFFIPACTAAAKLGITDPLGQTVVYDSHIQGGWGIVKAGMPAPAAGGQRDWIRQYVTQRAAWLQSGKSPLPTTVYRMTSFDALINTRNWDLQLPLEVHGITISQESLAGDVTTPGAAPRILQLTTPYLRGDDVSAVQKALLGKSLPATVDGVYGPFTAELVSEWQTKQDPPIAEKNVGPLTRASLGLS
jgi:chitosanase